MATLRSPRGCPWDRQQTHASLAPFLLEETYEALAAIDRADPDALPGELGDVLFQCVFHAQIAAEAGQLDLADAVEAIVAKLIRRHPHVFTAAGRPLSRAARARRRRTIGTAQAVVGQWEQLKAGEQARAGARKRLLTGVPAALPALARAHEIGVRVAAVGFDWPATGQVVEKIEEEVNELKAAWAEGPDRVAEELGDLALLDREPRAQARSGRRDGAPNGQRQVHPPVRGHRSGARGPRAVGARRGARRARSGVAAPEGHRRTIHRLVFPASVLTSTPRPSVSTVTAPSRSVRNSAAPSRS